MIQPIGWKRIASLRSRLISDATNTKADLLIVAAAGDIGIVVGQFAVPCVVRIVIITTPPVAVDANVEVWPIVVAVTAREGGEATDVGSARIGGIPIGGGFHGSAFVCTSPSRCLLIRY